MISEESVRLFMITKSCFNYTQSVRNWKNQHEEFASLIFSCFWNKIHPKKHILHHSCNFERHAAANILKTGCRIPVVKPQLATACYMYRHSNYKAPVILEHVDTIPVRTCYTVTYCCRLSCCRSHEWIDSCSPHTPKFALFARFDKMTDWFG